MTPRATAAPPARRALPLFPLVYACKFCGTVTAVFPDVLTDTRAVVSVCDKRKCRDAAHAQYMREGGPDAAGPALEPHGTRGDA